MVNLPDRYPHAAALGTSVERTLPFAADRRFRNYGRFADRKVVEFRILSTRSDGPAPFHTISIHRPNDLTNRTLQPLCNAFNREFFDVIQGFERLAINVWTHLSARAWSCAGRRESIGNRLIRHAVAFGYFTQRQAIDKIEFFDLSQWKRDSFHFKASVGNSFIGLFRLKAIRSPKSRIFSEPMSLFTI